MPELHLALKGAQSRLQHAAGCAEQGPSQEMPLAPQKEANGREEAVLEWVALEAVAVNVRQALELAVTAEAVLDEPAAVVLGLVLRERVLREQAHRDRAHREAVPQELGVLAQRVQVDLAEVENLVIEADKCNGHDSCADALH
jgi:hypothetical protein